MTAPRIGLLYGAEDGRQPETNHYKTRAMAFLQKLKGDKVILGPEDILMEDPYLLETIGEFDAIITRPNWGGIISSKMLDKLRAGCLLATLSAGDDHIAKISEAGSLRSIINARRGENSDATAEFTVWMGITLRRRLQLKLAEMAFGYQFGRNYDNLGTLGGCTWTILGLGDVGTRVFSCIPSFGVDRIVVYHYRQIEDRLRRALNEAGMVFCPFHSGSVVGNLCTRIKVNGRDRPCEVEATEDLPWALKQGDVISNHVRYVPLTPEKGGTSGILNKDCLQQFQPHAVVLNAARGECVADEMNYIEAVAKGRLGGYATDVLGKNAERRGIKDSVFWRAYTLAMISSAMYAVRAEREWRRASEAENALRTLLDELVPKGEFHHLFPNVDELRTRGLGAVPNILVSQHLAGAAADAEEKVATSVVGELLARLGLRKAACDLLRLKESELDEWLSRL